MTSAKHQSRHQVEPNEWIHRLGSYHSGLTAGGQHQPQPPRHRLAANESPMGVGERTAKAIADAAACAALYPDQYAHQLRRAIAQRWELQPERIVCGGGSDELLILLARVFLRPGTSAICCEHGFLLFPLITESCGAEPRVAREPSRRSDVDEILRRVDDTTRIIWLANPNNPTGTMLCNDEITQLHRQLPPHVLLVLDGAYAEFLPTPEQFPGIELVRGCDNVVMTRTFSKLYGLAGLRVGWLYAAQRIVDMLNALREPYNVSVTAQAAATAAVQDLQHENHARQHNITWRAWLGEQLSALGLQVLPSEANFLLVDFSSPQEAVQARDKLASAGIMVRHAAGYGFPASLRISVGSEHACRDLVACLREP